MKPSDSTNSLTELTGRDECFICLSVENDNGEPLVDSKLLRTCGCRFTVHPACWNEWMKTKTDFDCPICRRESMVKINMVPNPVLLVHVPVEFDSRRNFRTRRTFWIALCIVIIFAIAFILPLTTMN